MIKLKHLGFQFIDAGMMAVANEESVEKLDSYKNFFARSKGMARIIYCHDSSFRTIKSLVTGWLQGAIVVHNACTKEDLHGNTSQHVHIVTEQRLMRGFDYRAPTVGFALLIARQLDSKRAFL